MTHESRSAIGRRLGAAALLAACGVALALVSGRAPVANAQGRAPLVVFVTGDDEYRSEITMPMIAAILEKRHGLRTSVAMARPIPQTKANIEGLDALADADLMVMYTRFRALPDDQLARITGYVESGKPVVGLRTSTHAFMYPQGSPHTALNDGFGREVFGQRWITHHGHLSTTDVTVDGDHASHPILRGVTPFHARSWLYHVLPLNGPATILLNGDSRNSQQTARAAEYPPRQPVAWTREHKGGRVFFTTLGHPADFSEVSMRRLLINGILWALGREVPAAGADATPITPYVAPESFDLSKVPKGN
ncbi:MAG: ThuA domain-containing protein [Acidobacteria bacterium]|nr:ThuA domain-containing protein [Acidobacteriota bacterium]